MLLFLFLSEKPEHLFCFELEDNVTVSQENILTEVQKGFFPTLERKKVMNTESKCHVSTRLFLPWVLDVCVWDVSSVCFAFLSLFVCTDTAYLQMLPQCCLVRQGVAPTQALQHRQCQHGREGGKFHLYKRQSRLPHLAQSSTAKGTSKSSSGVQEGFGCCVSSGLPWKYSSTNSIV